MVSLFQELRRRRVFRVAGAYVVGGWVVLQVADLAMQSLELPDRALAYVWMAVIIGFPVALVFGWRYDITAAGIVRTPPADSVAAHDLSLKKPDYLILGALTAVLLAVVYGVVSSVRDIDTGARSVLHDAQTSSVAVLPLVNLSEDPDQAYFAAGMHDALLTSLAKITALKVISRTSSERVDRNLSVPEIGSVLNVANVVEGSVTREGDRIRIIVQLIDAATDEHLWAETYVRKLESVLSLQGEIARTIAQAIQVRLTPAELRELSAERTVDPATYEAYLKGMFQMHKETPRAYRRGIEILTEAVENDPTSALAYAGLAYGYSKLGHSPYPEGAYPRAKAAADRALEFDPNLAEAHAAVGMYRLYYEWDAAGAEESLIKAIELNPSLVSAYYHYAWLLELLGRKDEALKAGERTVELDPLSPFYSGWLAAQYISSGMYDQAITQAEATLNLRENWPVGWMTLGDAYLELGRYDEAIAAHAHLADSPFWSFVRGYSYASAGRIDDARAIVESIPAEADNALPLVLVYGAMGDTEQTLHWLEVARDSKLPWYPWLLDWFPQLRPIHGDPRLQELARELDLELP